MAAPETAAGSASASARAGNRRFWCLSTLRAHTKAPYKTDLHRKTLKNAKALNRPGRARTVRRAGRPLPRHQHALAADGHQRAAGAGLPAGVGRGGHHGEEPAQGLGEGGRLPVLRS
jgi:hypothetical protein